MPPNLGKAVLYLVGDSTQLDKDVDKAKIQVSKTLDKMGTNFIKSGAIITTAFTVPLAAAGNQMIEDASDLNETVSKIGVVFGSQAAKIEAFGDKAAKALGMSKNEALAAVGTYGNLFRSMGMAETKSADMSKGLVQLASDLASFNNLDPNEVLDKLRAGLTGESEPLKTLGININDAIIKEKALELGLGSTSVNALDVAEAENKLAIATEKANAARKKYGATSLQAEKALIAQKKAQEALDKAKAGESGQLDALSKAQAVYALIMEQTTLAQGDFARTSDGLANSQRILKAQVADASAKLGTQLLPIALKVVQGLSGIIDKFMKMSPAGQKTILIIGGIAAAIGPLLTVIGTVMTVVSGLSTFLAGPAVAAIGAVLAPIWPIIVIVAAVIGAIALLHAAWKNNWFGIRDITANVIGGIVGFWNNTFIPAIKSVANFIGNVLGAAFNNVKNSIMAVWDWIQRLMNSLTNIQLPKWMTPGSPTPWENGLRGVADAMGDLDSVFLPRMVNAFNNLNTATGTGVLTGGGLNMPGAIRSTNNNFIINNPIGETTDDSMSRALKRLQFLGMA